ncbi:MAG: NAD(P)/FAD-dependent oxidoreductase [Proteobacteria bacterium]|nr:MAG: NAD(P)/FAD-dependent oxidoreductase [Pseudomonadota bacterium]
MTDIDIIVVGAGVVGLAIGRALSGRGHEVLVLERHAGAGLETSSHNSGVIHAGIYYPAGSLRARLCVEGKRLLYAFCENNGVDTIRCGKLLVATRKDEIDKLDELRANAERNGVDDLVPLGAAEAGELEPDIRCAAACLSPSTGVIDSMALMAALSGHVEANHGQVVYDTAVRRIVRDADSFDVEFVSAGEHGRIRAQRLVIAAGHGATALASGLYAATGRRPPETHPARGHYYRLQGRHRFRHLVYPMPDGAWLGTHLTLDVAGVARFGPDNEWVDGVDNTFDDSAERQRRFYDAIRRYWPGVPTGSLAADYVGVRPKIYRSGEPVADFAIHGATEHGLDGLVALFGIESPGLTASLAIGEHVAGMLLDPAPGASP